MAAKPGEVWLADLGLAAKTRPVVILSRDDPQAPRALVVYVPLTTQNRGSRYEIELGRVRFLNGMLLRMFKALVPSRRFACREDLAYSRPRF